MSDSGIINVYEAKTHLSKLCDQAAGGLDVIIARHGRPWVRLTALERPKLEIKYGLLKGEVGWTEAFDEPLGEEELRLFEES